MAIIRPESMDFSKQTFSAIIYGSPGVGKTTLALSAPNPVLIDFDDGVSRVRASHRTPTIICNTYEEVLTDVQSPEIKEFETIVIDTGGAFVAYLKDWAMRKKGDVQKNGEFNGRSGYGHVKSEFMSFTNMIKDVLKMNVIYVFHSNEEKDVDGNPQQRLICEGATRNLVWNPCEFGGYLQVIGNKRTLCFDKQQEYFTKSSHGIDGRYEIPVLADGVPNDFMAKLFEQARQSIIAENEAYAPQKAKYEEVMGDIRTIVENVVDQDSANLALSTISDLEHALTSKKEAGAMLNTKAATLGLKYSKKDGCYIPKE